MKWLLFSCHVSWVMVSVRGRKLLFMLCGVSKGAEAAVHVVRCYIKSLDSSRVLIKLDFKNAQCTETKCLKLCKNLLHQFSLLYILHTPCPHPFTGVIRLFNLMLSLTL